MDCVCTTRDVVENAFLDCRLRVWYVRLVRLPSGQKMTPPQVASQVCNARVSFYRRHLKWQFEVRDAFSRPSSYST